MILLIWNIEGTRLKLFPDNYYYFIYLHIPIRNLVVMVGNMLPQICKTFLSIFTKVIFDYQSLSLFYYLGV